MNDVSGNMLLNFTEEFVSLQSRLCATIWQEYASAECAYFRLPEEGQLQLDGEDWDFSRHGAGVEFIRRRDRLSIDAHKHMGNHPDAFDAWRLSLFLESKKITEVLVGEKYYLTEEMPLRAALDQLAHFEFIPVHIRMR